MVVILDIQQALLLLALASIGPLVYLIRNCRKTCAAFEDRMESVAIPKVYAEELVKTRSDSERCYRDLFATVRLFNGSYLDTLH